MKTKPVLPALFVILLCLYSGCSQEGNVASTRPTTEAAPALQNFPLAEQLLLASLQVRLDPNRMVSVRAPGSGRLKLQIEQPIVSIEQDTVWAILEQDALDTESRSLELWKQQLDTRQEVETQLELPLQRLQIQKQLDDAQRTLKVWEMYQQDSERGRRTMELLGIDPGSGNPAEIQRLQWEIELLETQLRYLQSERPVSDLELQSRRVEWEQRRLEFLKKEALSRMAAPFNGELRLLALPQDDRNEIWIQSGEEIALIRDLSKAVLRLKPDDFTWSSAPFYDLILQVYIPGFPEIRALPVREEMEYHSSRQERVWVFELETGVHPVHQLPIGSPVSVRLIQTLPSIAKIIPKSTLIAHPKAQGEHWSTLLQSAYPDSVLLAVGQTELAVESAP